MTALDRVVGRNLRRQRAAANLLAELADLPEVVDRFTAWLKDADLAWRAEVIELVGRRDLHPLAPLLNDALAENGDEHCRAYAITSAGQLRSEVCLPAILKMASGPSPRLWNRLLWALKDYTHPRCRPLLKRVWRDGLKRDQVIAAWGLGKLGDKKAIRYLADMLDDVDTVTATTFDPGESLRAAQALCDIHGWPFKWDRGWVAKTRRRWRQDDDVAICVRQLGSLVEKERVDAAQALTFFVYQADNSGKAMRTALTALAAGVGDPSLKVRRAVLNSLDTLVPDAADIPAGFVGMVTPALADPDAVVQSRAKKVLKGVEKRLASPGRPTSPSR